MNENLFNLENNLKELDIDSLPPDNLKEKIIELKKKVEKYI